MPTILIADLPSPARDGLARVVGAAGHRVVLADTSDEAPLLATAERCELVLLAVRDGQGADTAARIKEQAGFVPVLALTGGDAAARAALLAVVEDVVAQPCDPTELVARVAAHLRTRRIFEGLNAARIESEARSYGDPVTGLRNRQFLTERLVEEYKRAQRFNEPLSLLVLSIDGHADAVERRGVTVGDKMLRIAARAANKVLRQIDIIARLGPAELAALLPNTHFAGSLTCADRLRKELSHTPSDEPIFTASMGIAFFPGKDVAEPFDLLRQATKALERARGEGPANICLVQHQGYLFQSR